VVVLRANLEGGFVPVEQTLTDADGMFAFEDLPLGADVTYLPGVNHQDVHYPGPRLELTEDHPEALVQIVAYDAVESPSPLVCRCARLDVESGDGFVEITETLTITNPTRVAYVGEAIDDRPPVTIRFSLPPGFDKITFDKEFNGRNFLLHDNQLISDLPWPPGERDIRFRYRLPAANGRCAISRETDLPTEKVVVRVFGMASDQVVCSLGTTPEQIDDALVFEQAGQPLAAGHPIAIEVGALPIAIEVYARWVAVALLSVAVAAAAIVAWRRRAVAVATEESADTGVDLRESPRRADLLPFEGATPKNMPSPADRRERRRRRAA
jgi:hypothetical protein